MKQPRTRNIVVTALLAFVAVAAVVGLWTNQATGQTRAAYRAPRTPDGKPDLSGIWEAHNNVHWNLEDHQARAGAVVALGALGAVPAGLSVVEGGEIPYKPAALAKRKENADNWLARDPAIKCFMPGVPRATYMPFPFQIIQSPGNTMLIAYEFAAASRLIHMNEKAESEHTSWMGWSRGRWEGETLVIDVTDMNEQSWLDAAGNHHSDKLHVVERYTATSPYHLQYEATIEDPDVYTRPWKISMPLYRRIEPRAQILEFKCVEFVEELMYGHLKKPGA
jgi:hypothetical protein